MLNLGFGTVTRVSPARPASLRPSNRCCLCVLPAVISFGKLLASWIIKRGHTGDPASTSAVNPAGDLLLGSAIEVRFVMEFLEQGH